MLCAFPHFAGDVAALKRLLLWIERLGGCPKHDALLVADCDTLYSESAACMEIARRCFRNVSLITNEIGVAGWPDGPNSLFCAAAKHIDEPWFWCETDCVPLKAGWLDALEDAHKKCGKPFMGAIVPCGTPGLPPEHLNGNTCYPANAWGIMRAGIVPGRAFDISTAEIVVPNAVNTVLVQHFWGKRDLAPTFTPVRGPGSPINAFTLDNLQPEAVVFHRNPDGSLIDMLWARMEGRLGKPGAAGNRIVVVLPYCNNDAGLAIKNLDWMREIHGRIPFDCLLSTDRSTLTQHTADMTRLARSVFQVVWFNQYQRPPFEGWPKAANWAFVQAAQYISTHVRRPWLWMEPDATALKPDWMHQLQAEYERCKKPFMGVIVMGMGHMNGVGVYPGDFPRWCPNTMKEWDDAAFDTKMKPEMIRHCQDIGRLICHVWGIHGGKPHPNRGSPIVFRSESDLACIPHEAVMFHREKQGSLVDMLRKMKQGGNPLGKAVEMAHA